MVLHHKYKAFPFFVHHPILEKNKKMRKGQRGYCSTESVEKALFHMILKASNVHCNSLGAGDSSGWLLDRISKVIIHSKSMINLPSGDGLYKSFMVILGMVYCLVSQPHGQMEGSRLIMGPSQSQGCRSINESITNGTSG